MTPRAIEEVRGALGLDRVLWDHDPGELTLVKGNRAVRLTVAVSGYCDAEVWVEAALEPAPEVT